MKLEILHTPESLDAQARMARVIEAQSKEIVRLRELLRAAEHQLELFEEELEAAERIMEA